MGKQAFGSPLLFKFLSIRGNFQVKVIIEVLKGVPCKICLS